MIRKICVSYCLRTLKSHIFLWMVILIQYYTSFSVFLHSVSFFSSFPHPFYFFLYKLVLRNWLLWLLIPEHFTMQLDLLIIRSESAFLFKLLKFNFFRGLVLLRLGLQSFSQIIQIVELIASLAHQLPRSSFTISLARFRPFASVSSTWGEVILSWAWLFSLFDLRLESTFF